MKSKVAEDWRRAGAKRALNKFNSADASFTMLEILPSVAATESLSTAKEAKSVVPNHDFIRELISPALEIGVSIKESNFVAAGKHGAALPWIKVEHETLRLRRPS